MISRARIVIGETVDGKLELLHASFDPVRALAVFRDNSRNVYLSDVAMIENGVITRRARPAITPKSSRVQEPPVPVSIPITKKTKK